MHHLRVNIVRFLNADNPGFVEARFVDAAGHEWLFRDKVPIFTVASIDADTPLPQDGFIRCQLIKQDVRSDGRTIAVVDTELPDHVDATTGDTRFEVFAEQLVVP